MKTIDWKSKLTSRKFWVAVAGFVTGLMAYFKADAEQIDRIGGLIMQAASVIAYIIGEGLTDAAREKGDTIIEQTDEPDDE